MEEMVQRLVNARWAWNKLDDAIYSIAGGDINNSVYALIYDNYEECVMGELIKAFPHRKEFLESYFCGVVLDLADIKYVTLTVGIQDKEVEIKEFLELLSGDFDLEYVESWRG